MLIALSKLTWLAGVIGWYFIRLPHQRRSRRTPVSKTARTPQEITSLIISGTGLGPLPALVVFSGWFSFADRTHHWSLYAAGTVIFIAALVLFRRTHKALGKNWSVSLDLRDDHKLVTDGVYQMARHPMYTAFWLWAIAQLFLLPNWIAGLSGIICFGQLYFLRVPKEEKLMEQQFGEQYREYSKKTGRLWPKFFSKD